jgi:hypothetical protein
MTEGGNEIKAQSVVLNSIVLKGLLLNGVKFVIPLIL